MRKILLLVMIAMLAMVSGSAFAQGDDTEWTCPEGFEGQTLRIFNWSTYVAEETIPRFEELCGVKVEYDVFESNEAALTVIREGSAQYDIVVPSDFTVEIMIAEGLLREINFDNIPNFANVAEKFINPPYDPEGKYAVPYQWGTIGIGYSLEYVGEPITTWRQVFEYDGPVAWISDPRATFGVALQFLGYDPNTTNPDEIAEATQFLIDNGQNVVAIAADDGQVMLERGDVDITVEYSGDVFQVIADCECEDFAFSIPEEGTVVWTDNMVIPTSAPNPELAEVYMDYILDAHIGAELSNYIAFASPNQAAIDQALIVEEQLTNPGIYPEGDAAENLFFIRSVGESEPLYSEGWTEVLTNLGQ